jgi:hypothetical protein
MKFSLQRFNLVKCFGGLAVPGRTASWPAGRMMDETVFAALQNKHFAMPEDLLWSPCLGLLRDKLNIVLPKKIRSIIRRMFRASYKLSEILGLKGHPWKRT